MDVLGKFLGCIKAVKDPLKAQERRWDFSPMPSGKGPHLALRGESPGFSRVAAANLGSLSIYDGDLRDPLLRDSGTSSLHASFEGPLGIPLQSLLGPRSSFGVQVGTSVFLSCANIELGLPLGFAQESQASFRVETCNSALLSSWKSSVRLPVMLT